MKKLTLTISVLLLASACNQQVQVQPVQTQPVKNQGKATTTQSGQNDAVAQHISAKEISCPTIYQNSQYGFKFNCLSGFKILELPAAVRADYGWPHAIVLVECTKDPCQVYSLIIEEWNNQSEFLNTYKTANGKTSIEVSGGSYTGKLVGNKYISISIWDSVYFAKPKQMVSTLTFTK